MSTHVFCHHKCLNCWWCLWSVNVLSYANKLYLTTYVRELLWNVGKWKVLKVLMYFRQLQIQQSCVILHCILQSDLYFVWNNCNFCPLCSCIAILLSSTPLFFFLQTIMYNDTTSAFQGSLLSLCDYHPFFIFKLCSRDDSVSVLSYKHENW